MTALTTARDSAKWLLFPGLNLHARLRNRVLPRYFGRPFKGEIRTVLDAGCGNGMLAYQAYLRGNRAVGISNKRGEVERNRRLFHGLLGVSDEHLRFEVGDLHELPALGMKFDEIICAEVLEHIADDRCVCRHFWSVLGTEGVLHLCCPNADHPDNRSAILDRDETGGHVRPGYTVESYRALLEPLGFQIKEVVGLGGPMRQWCNKRITRAQQLGGLPLGMIAFLPLWPMACCESSTPRVPYSLYVRAVKTGIGVREKQG